MRARTEPDECDGVVDCARQYAADVVDTVETFGQEFMNNRINDMREAGADGIADTAQAVQDTLFPAETVTTSSNSISGDENGVCDEDDENSCGVQEGPDDVEYAEYEEAEEHEEFDEEEFFENEDDGDEEEEEADDNGDGANGDGEYDPRSEREQLNDPMFDHERYKWIGPKHGVSNYKFNLIERLPHPPYTNRLYITEKLLYCKSKGSTNKRVAFNIAADQGHALRSELTHRDSIGVSIGQGSRHWARGQTHGETVIALNLKLGVKRVFDERINLADDWSSYPFDVRILGRYMEFGMLEQDLESLELRPGPILKCVWATGLKSYTLADDLGFSMDVAFAGGRSNTGNNIMKCWAGVDRMKNVLVFTGWPWAREEFGLVKPQVALRQFHAFDEFKSPSPVWNPSTTSPFTHRLLHPQVIPH